VRKLELPRVEHQTSSFAFASRRLVGVKRSAKSGIEIIADDGMADGAQVHPNLMGPPRHGAHHEQRFVGKSLQDAEFRDGRLPRGENLHLLASGGIAPDGTLDPPLVFEDPPPHERQIELFDLPSFELLDQSQIRRVALGHEQDAAGPLV